MDVNKVRVCVLRIEGTNCEEESYHAFQRLGANTEIVHLNEFARKKKKLSDYHALVLPGGFSAGDYIRAGVIFAARMKSTLGKELEEFITDHKPIIGICNGFQILVEAGILPGLSAVITDEPEAVLTTNDSDHFECRPTWLRKEAKSRCIFTRELEDDKVIMIPSAHAEGKFVLPAEREQQLLEELKKNGQVVFRYVSPEGKSEPGYPFNPNGAIYDIAGICNRTGNVLGMMPHPERVFFRHTHNDWTRDPGSASEYGDGKGIFKSALNHVVESF
jgi:phosphoribosylformylglycinamidine synthase subunit PurQ / glutaminase